MAKLFRTIVSKLHIQVTEWKDSIPLVQSALNQAPSPQRNNIAPVTTMAGIDSSPPIKKVLKSETENLVTLQDAQHDRSFNIHILNTCKTCNQWLAVLWNTNSSERTIRATAGGHPTFRLVIAFSLLERTLTTVRSYAFDSADQDGLLRLSLIQFTTWQSFKTVRLIKYNSLVYVIPPIGY